MKKFKPNYLKPTMFNSKDYWMVGVIWTVKSSKDDVYNVELHDEGFNCDCLGFTYRGSCKHSQSILKQVEGV